MSKINKLGRNPLEKLSNGATHESVTAYAMLKRTPSRVSALEKIKEMQIEVDWFEVYNSTLGRRLDKWVRFFERAKDLVSSNNQ